jgi:hypothetical protein
VSKLCLVELESNDVRLRKCLRGERLQILAAGIESNHGARSM